MAPARRAASSCPPRPARPSASNAGPTTRCSRWTRTRSSPSSPRASRRGRPTSSSTRAATASSTPLLDDSRAADARRRRRARPAADGAVLLDVREPADFAAGHLRGAVNVGLQGRFAEWAADVLSPDRDDRARRRSGAAPSRPRSASAVSGYDRVVGQLDDPAALFATASRAPSRRARG